MKTTKLIIPYLIWMFIFTVIPLILLVHYAFTTGAGTFTFENLTRFFSPLYLNILRRSFSLAIQATLICFVIAYPVAYILSTKEYRDRNVLVFLFIVPMWMNFLVRTYSWMFILGSNGILNNTLRFFGLDPVTIMFTDTAVLIGLVYTFLPFMVFPIYSSLQKIDQKIIEGAQDLGADTFDIIKRIIFPLSLPGIASGLTMVFMPAVATFLISNLLGGGQFILIGNLIEQQFLSVGNRNFGSMISIILLALTLICNFFLSNMSKEEE